MYEVRVEAEFCAAHSLMIGGVREAVHGHNFRVCVCIGGERLDGDGLLVDFHAVERALGEVVGPWRNADLNATAAFSAAGKNPSAENIAREIGEELGRVVNRGGVRVEWVSVTEAPGCTAVWRAGR